MRAPSSLSSKAEPPRGPPPAAGRRQARERGVDRDEREPGRRGGAGGAGGGEGGGPQADPALARLAGEVGDRDLDLLGGRPPQELGEGGDLLAPRARVGDAAGGGDELGEAHGRSASCYRERPR